MNLILTRRSLINSTVCAALLAGTGIAAAQDAAANFPNKPITFIVPYAPGGSSDVRARQLGQKLSEYLKVPVVVENKSGANGNIGTNAIAKAAADGYTIGIGNLAPLTVNKTFTPNATPFDPATDLVPVILIEKGPIVLLVNADKSPHKDLKGLVGGLKEARGKMSFASAGQGGAYHLAGEIFKANMGVFAVHIPYRSGGQALNDLVAGQVDFMFDMAPASLPFLQSTPPKMRALAVANDKRLPSLPNVPTFAELGYKNMEMSNWLGVVAPKGVPAAVLDKLNKALNRALQEPDMVQRITGPGNLIGGGDPKVFEDLLSSERVRWTKLIQEKGIKPE